MIGTVPRELHRGLKHMEIREKIEIIQTAALLRSAIVPRIVRGN